MNSKVSFETLYETVGMVKRNSPSGPEHGFHENVELEIGLKNYNPQTQKRFRGSVLLQHIARPQLKVCVFGNQRHCDEARSIGVDFLDVEDLKILGCDKKYAKRLAKEYDEFLVSESLAKIVPRLLGPGLTNAGKFPTPLNHQESMRSKIDVISTSSLQMKKILCLNVTVGHVGMGNEELTQNINLSIRFLVSLLKENWRNVRSLHIKTRMGQPQRIY